MSITLTAEVRPRLEFDAVEHRYELVDVAGTRRALPSVTTILRTVGYINFSGVPGDILERALARGTRVHQALQYWSEGLLDWTSVGDEDRPYVEAGAEWMTRAGFSPLAQEVRLYHATWQYAGTCDLLGWQDGQPAIADFKTGDPRDVAADLQLMFYAEAVRQCPPVEWIDFTPSTPITRVSVALTRDGAYKAEPYPDDAEHWNECLAALTTYYGIQRRARRGRKAAA